MLAPGEGAGGRGLGLLSLFQAPGQVTFRSSPGAQGPVAPSSQGRLLALTARWAGLLWVHFRAAIFFCFALIFSILAIEDKQRKPFSSPAVKTPLPFCWFPCLPFPLNPRQRKRCLDIPSTFPLVKRVTPPQPPPNNQCLRRPRGWDPLPGVDGLLFQVCMGSMVGGAGGLTALCFRRQSGFASGVR